MTMRETFVKERNDALFSLDRKKIEAYCAKHGDTDTAEDKVREARTWLASHGFSDTIRL